MAASRGMSVLQTVHKLHAVSLIKSGIRRPWWEKRTLKVLGLTKLHKTVIHKNTPAVNGLLRSVKHLVDVRPVVVVEGKEKNSTDRGQQPAFLTSDGTFDAKAYKEFVEANQ